MHCIYIHLLSFANYKNVSASICLFIFSDCLKNYGPSSLLFAFSKFCHFIYILYIDFLDHFGHRVLNGFVMVTGGCDPASDKPKIPLKLVHRMFPKVQQWTRMANMLEARMNHCACAVRDKIYVFGGVGDRNR